MNILDEIRRHYPTLGLAVYAYEPAGGVTLEVHSPVGVVSFEGPDLDGLLRRAFPLMFAPELPPVGVDDRPVAEDEPVDVMEMFE